MTYKGQSRGVLKNFTGGFSDKPAKGGPIDKIAPVPMFDENLFAFTVDNTEMPLAKRHPAIGLPLMKTALISRKYSRSFPFFSTIRS